LRISPGRSLRLTGAIATSAALSIGVFAGTASASSVPAGGQAVHKYCEVKLAPVQPGQSVSRVVSRTCHEGTASSASPKRVSAAASYRIITLYQNTGYGGLGLEITGSQPCSSSVYYKIADTNPADWGVGSWGISSWQAHSSCWHTTIYSGYNGTGSHWTYGQGVWEAGQIGSGFNDHVLSVWTRYK
jgi:hypothetical protein